MVIGLKIHHLAHNFLDNIQNFFLFKLSSIAKLLSLFFLLHISHFNDYYYHLF